jgi:copper chaperone
MTTATFTVQGMTCGHCVAAVTEEVGRIPGVSDVQVELDSGAVTITSADDVSTDDVKAAVEEAGYELVT